MAETKYIFVTGGVASSLGKGIISSSIGKLLQARGYSVTIQKFDPYINIDPGTLNPYEGYVQSRMSCFNRGNIDEFFFTTELSRKYDDMTWRVGVNEWYYDVDYASNTTMYDHTCLLYTSPSPRD